ncbi:MAG: hypothetical protein PHF37_06970 [Phycisphaerae bacterium]|nr:hypothetical protein [Phycisphaerae bacterium]
MKFTLRIAVSLLIFLTLPLTSGCGIEGRWESKSFKPEIARDKFRLMGPTIDSLGFRKTTIVFAPNGRFNAQAVYGNRTENSNGEWELSKGKLTLIDEAGHPYTYDIKLKDFNTAINLTRRIEGTDVILTLRKVPFENDELEE